MRGRGGRVLDVGVGEDLSSLLCRRYESMRWDDYDG